MSAYVVVGASSSVAWKFKNEADTDHLTVMYGDGDMTLGSDPIPRYVEISRVTTGTWYVWLSIAYTHLKAPKIILRMNVCSWIIGKCARTKVPSCKQLRIND